MRPVEHNGHQAGMRVEVHRKMKHRYGCRLTVPLVRQNGVLREATWDAALARAAAAFDIACAMGPGAFGIFSCSKASNEMNFLAQKFARQVMGTNNIDSCNRT